MRRLAIARSLTARWRADGQALILFALVLPVLVAISGLVIDAGHLYFERRHLQSIADAAAIAGAQKVNFDTTNPAIIDDADLTGNNDGEEQAITNALANGAVGGTDEFVTVDIGGGVMVTGMHSGEASAFVPPVTAPYSGYARPNAHIEVMVERRVDHWFMYYLGMRDTTIRARAVARGYTHFSRNPALLALDVGNETAIVFDGGGSTFLINGDIVSYGGIKANGVDDNFDINGQAIAYGSVAAGVDATGGSFGIDTGAIFTEALDPVLECLDRGQCTMPAWPTSPPGCASVVKAGVAQPSKCGSPITIDTDEVATFSEGTYGLIEVKGNGRVIFEPGRYVITDRLDVGSQATASGNGVEMMFTGACWVINITGGANLDFSAPTGSTFMNIVFFAPYGSIDLNGTTCPTCGPYDGTRTIKGTIYAPGYIDGQGAPWIPEANSNGDSPYGNKRCNNPANGTVEVSGDANTGLPGAPPLLDGQLISSTIRFDGNAPLISFTDNQEYARFGVVLVNTP